MKRERTPLLDLFKFYYPAKTLEAMSIAYYDKRHSKDIMEFSKILVNQVI